MISEASNQLNTVGNDEATLNLAIFDQEDPNTLATELMKNGSDEEQLRHGHLLATK